MNVDNETEEFYAVTGLFSESLLNLYTSWSANLDKTRSAQPRSVGTRFADKAASQDKPGQGVPQGTGDAVSLSPAAQRCAGQPAKTGSTGQTDPKADAQGLDGLSEEDRREVEKLKSRDQQVRSHEQAHLAAAGSLARGGARLQYQIGPDGKRYAAGGEVSIDTSPVDDDPRATIAKAYRIQRAAMAPAEPSPQDRSVAAEAAAMAVRTQQELSKQFLEKSSRAASEYGMQNANNAASRRVNIRV